ncbi:DNA alkylation repair protein [uncultured Campylobacter sp.]|uniref:DNA alkylation repair protein n=1 Tax=uncultured Campylobacter sp. TaxID=218934 RepID=UPI00260E5505|nr:DNA alkylation repair protein [uncultured Campylobacter sp.]
MDLREKMLGRLRALSEEKFAQFSQRLIPAPQILGVRTPTLRALAHKSFAALGGADEARHKLQNYEPFFHEEFVLKGFFIMLLKQDEAKFALASDFIKTMPNWAVCDMFAPKFRDAALAGALLKQAKGGADEFERRFFYVYFMRNMSALTPEEFFEICAAENDKQYYVQMGAAWAIAEMFIKQREITLAFLASKRAAKFTQNKAISKIRDSFRVSKAEKDALLKYKI